jgi:pyruvate/2-oxoglutarate dehydrogenase complex dihydrolipoamide acyltransferase (E2) component
MFEWLIRIFIFYIIYLIMEKSKTTTEKPVPKAKVKAEQPVATVETKATPQKPSPDQKAAKKTQIVAPIPVATAETKEAPKKPSPDQKPVKKAPAVAPEPVASIPEMTMSERVGLTAGSIWHYLDENGATPVAKLVRELTEEEKIIHRSIGWLAQEGKIMLDVVDQVETLALKE